MLEGVLIRKSNTCYAEGYVHSQDMQHAAFPLLHSKQEDPPTHQVPADLGCIMTSYQCVPVSLLIRSDMPLVSSIPAPFLACHY